MIYAFDSCFLRVAPVVIHEAVAEKQRRGMEKGRYVDTSILLRLLYLDIYQLIYATLGSTVDGMMAVEDVIYSKFYSDPISPTSMTHKKQRALSTMSSFAACGGDVGLCQVFTSPCLMNEQQKHPFRRHGGALNCSIEVTV